MNPADTAEVEQAAARAALAVPGVVELPPTLSQSLAGAGIAVRQALGSTRPSPEEGIHLERDPRSGACRVEVRCVLDDLRRPLDAARDVHDRVRAAVASRTGRPGARTPGTIAVTVTVTVTRIVPCQVEAAAP